MTQNLSTVLDEYIEARYSDEKPNPEEYIQRVPEEQQKELALLIKGFELGLKKINFDEIMADAGTTESFIKRFWARVDKEKNQ